MVQLRAELHLKAKKQDDSVALSVFNPEDQFHLSYLPQLFKVMCYAMERYIERKMKQSDAPFNLEQIIQHDFKEKLTQIKTAADHQQ